mmetsp:Transcript_43970/g.143049  ORF Transcript_43970/g.143049 Transcript_43970/m.143049 type:complete len:201 (+) Transcript_43970:3-605(+)
MSGGSRPPQTTRRPMRQTTLRGITGAARSGPASPTRAAADPHDMQRFASKQALDHDRAVRELKDGRKAGCWSWWIFPTPPFIRNGERVGSPINQVYELADDAEGLAYLLFRDGQLRSNYLAVLDAMSGSLEEGVEPRRLLGIDVPRAVASVRYFSHLATLGDGDEALRDGCERALGLLVPDDSADAGGGGGRQQKRAHPG